MRTAPVLGFVPDSFNKMPPTMSTGAPVTVFRFVATGNRSACFTPNCERILVGMVKSCAPVSAQLCWDLSFRDRREVVGAGMQSSEYAALSTQIAMGRVGLGLACFLIHPV